jgi:hypothetical protein
MPAPCQPRNHKPLKHRVLIIVLARQVAQVGVFTTKQVAQGGANSVFLIFAVATQLIKERLVATFVPNSAIYCGADFEQ